MPKHTKRSATHRRRRPKRGRKGKGTNHKAILILGLAVTVIIVIVQALRFTFLQFSLLFTEPAAVHPAGWLVIALLITMGGYFITRWTLNLRRHMIERKTYEASLYHEKTHLPYKTMLKTPGAYHEYRVSSALEAAYPKKTQWVNVLIKRKDALNEYAEIDILLFDASGLYVIECKDYDGYVYGGARSAYWTVGYDTAGVKKTYEFQNPVLQNEKHIQDIQAHVDATCHNAVLFSEKTVLDTDIREITTVDSLIHTIETRAPIYTENDLDTFKKALSRVRSSEARQAHIQRIQFNRSKYTG